MAMHLHTTTWLYFKIGKMDIQVRGCHYPIVTDMERYSHNFMYPTHINQCWNVYDEHASTLMIHIKPFYTIKWHWTL